MLPAAAFSGIMAMCVAWASPTRAGRPGGPEPAAAARKVLIVTGDDYPGHKWRLTTPVLAAGLRKDARLTVRVVEDANVLAADSLNEYDAVVLHWMNWQKPDPGQKAREGLRRFVEGGKGLVLVHFACGAFQDWPEFRKLAGRSYDPKLRGHDPYGPFRVEIADPAHPITRGLAAFETVDELYTCLAGDDPIHILATARSKVDGKDYPIAFVLTYGKGRVFHCPLGHDVKALENAGATELLRRGVAWAAGLPPVSAQAASTPAASTAATRPASSTTMTSAQAEWNAAVVRGPPSHAYLDCIVTADELDPNPLN